jgi:hypothetical protein
MKVTYRNGTDRNQETRMPRHKFGPRFESRISQNMMAMKADTGPVIYEFLYTTIIFLGVFMIAKRGLFL